MQVVNSISCINNGGFRMKFKLEWPGGKSGWSDYYNNPESESFDLSNFNITEGSEVWIIVSVMDGKTKTANEHVKYSRSASANATYKVTGATLTYHISLEG